MFLEITQPSVLHQGFPGSQWKMQFQGSSKSQFTSPPLKIKDIYC